MVVQFLNASRRDFLEKLRVLLLVKKFTDFYGPKFMTVFETVRQFFPFWARWIQVTWFHPISLSFILVLFSQPHFRLLRGIFPSGSPHQNCSSNFILLHACHKPIPPCHLWFDRPENIWRWVYIIKLLVIQLPPSSYFFPFRLNVCLSTLSSKTHNLSIFRNLRDLDSHPRVTTVKIVFHYT